MERIEGIVFWITVFLYMAAFLKHLHAFTRNSFVVCLKWRFRR